MLLLAHLSPSRGPSETGFGGRIGMPDAQRKPANRAGRAFSRGSYSLHMGPAMSGTSPDFTVRLRAAGLRPTRQRVALARLLFEGEHRHVTAESLHAEVRGTRLPVSLATVYNALNQFRDAGLLREVVVAPGRSYFDTNTGHHHHFFVETGRRTARLPVRRGDHRRPAAAAQGHAHVARRRDRPGAPLAPCAANRLQFLELF